MQRPRERAPRRRPREHSSHAGAAQGKGCVLGRAPLSLHGHLHFGDPAVYTEGHTPSHGKELCPTLFFLSQTGDGWRKRAELVPIISMASGKEQQLPPSLGLLGGEQQRSQLHPACVPSKKYLLPRVAGSLLTSLHPLQDKYLVTKQCWRPKRVQQQPCRCSHTWFGLFFVPGKPPYTPNSAILRLSGAVKTLVVFPTDSLARRLSLALFLTLTVGHPKGISAGCSAGSVGHQ